MSLSWKHAAKLLLIADAKKRAGGWPNTFTAQQLALLQYPTDEARDNLGKQRRMIKEIHEAVESGHLDSEPNFQLDLNYSAESDETTPGFARFGASRAMSSRPVRRHVTQLATEKIYIISCESFSRWWIGQNEKSSNHIQSWLEARLPVTPPSSDEKNDSSIVKLKKAALIKECKQDWPTIEEDLREASRNGLKAKAHQGHSYWDATAGIAWAREKGKWKPDLASKLEELSRSLSS